MSATYFIRGTISVQVGCGKSVLWVTPCAGFLTPDKKKVIAFPNQSETATTAELIKLSDGKKFACKAEKIMKYLPALISLASQSKAIELSLDLSNPDNTNVVGFTYPAPSDHEHRC